MHVFVTGATGVIGRRVIPLLVGRRHTVTAMVRTPTALPHLQQAGATPVTADLFDLAALTRAFAGHEVVINLATHMPSPVLKMMFRRSWRMNDRIRSEGAANVARAALDCGVGTLLQESFAMVYPDRRDEWIDETTPLSPSAYNRTVLDAERAVASFTDAGRRGIALRFAAFYGPDAMQVRSYVRALRMGWAAVPGSPDGFISSVSHDDAAAAVVAAIDAPPGAYTVTDDVPLRRREYFGSLARTLRLPAPHFLPGWTVPMFGSVGEAMARSLRLSNRKLRHATNWAPKYPSARDGWPAMLDALATV
jgi:nucleoside-diphosphate-sugar epimerase